MFINTVSSSTARLSKLLELVDYRHGMSYSMISSESLRDIVLKTVDKKGLSINKTQSWLVYHLPKEAAAKLDVQ